nr:serine/threonine-protein kinase STY13-like [Ipomoea trifida]
MEMRSHGFVMANQIDLKSLDEQLERHLNRAWTMEIGEEQEEADAGLCIELKRRLGGKGSGKNGGFAIGTAPVHDQLRQSEPLQ